MSLLGAGFALYVRSRALPATVAAVLGTAAAAAWSASWLQSQSAFDHTARVPVVVLGPLLAASAIGTSLYTASDELDRTAPRPWPLRRAAHVLALTALAVALLALSVPGHPEEFGGPAIVRNTLGAVGVTAAAAALIGARPSWLPMTVYVGSVYVAAPSAPGVGRRCGPGPCSRVHRPVPGRWRWARSPEARRSTRSAEPVPYEPDGTHPRTPRPAREPLVGPAASGRRPRQPLARRREFAQLPVQEGPYAGRHVHRGRVQGPLDLQAVHHGQLLLPHGPAVDARLQLPRRTAASMRSTVCPSTRS